jgi:hypothetical protein
LIRTPTHYGGKIMTKFKDFGSGNSTGEKEPVSFKLHGETFECRAELQGKVLLDLVASSASENGADAAKTINDFFKQVLLPESYERFNTLLVDPERIVSVDTLGEISGWLVENYAARPEAEPEVS